MRSSRITSWRWPLPGRWFSLLLITTGKDVEPCGGMTNKVVVIINYRWSRDMAGYLGKFASGLMLAAASSWVNASSSSLACQSWPIQIATSKLKGAGLLDLDKLDASKTKAVRLASEQVRQGLYQEVYHIVLQQSDGKQLEVISHSYASDDECSASGVDVYLISKRLLVPEPAGAP